MTKMGNKLTCTVAGKVGPMGNGGGTTGAGGHTSNRALVTASNGVTPSKSYSSAVQAIARATASCTAEDRSPAADTAPAGPMGTDKHHHSGPAAPTRNSNCSEEDPDVQAIGDQLGACFAACSRLFVTEMEKMLPSVADTAVKRRKAQLEREHAAALQQAQSKFDADTKVLKSSYEQQLRAKDASITAALKKERQACQSLTADVAATKEALAVKEQACTSSELALQVKEKQVQQLQLQIDDMEFELEGMKCRGRELFTYQGLSTSEASLHQLNIAIKELTTEACNVATQLLEEHAALPRVPQAVALDSCSASQLKQLNMCGLLHAVWCEVSRLVFTDLRSSDLDLTFTTRSCRDMPCSDHDTVALQLQLEKKKALDWLRMLGAEGSCGRTSNSSWSGGQASTSLQTGFAQLTSRVIDSLLAVDCGHSPTDADKLVLWPTAEPQGGLTNVCSKPEPVAAALQPAVHKLVVSAVRVQVLASAMHSQLIRLVVPGWRQLDVSGLCRAVAAAALEAVPQLAALKASWETGVVPVGSWSRHGISVGTQVPANPHMVLKGVDAAVFCQEPAVVQLAERVEHLPEFGGQLLVKPFKILRNARMCVAHAEPVASKLASSTDLTSTGKANVPTKCIA